MRRMIKVNQFFLHRIQLFAFAGNDAYIGIHAIFQIPIHLPIAAAGEMVIHPLIHGQRLADIDIVIMQQIIEIIKRITVCRNDVTTRTVMVLITFMFSGVDNPVGKKLLTALPFSIRIHRSNQNDDAAKKEDNGAGQHHDPYRQRHRYTKFQYQKHNCQHTCN